MADFFSADQHLGHHRIIELTGRPHADVDEMFVVHETRWRERVTAADTVYLLGDLAMGDARANLERFAQLPGRKILVPGNHDKCFPARKDSEKWVSVYEGFGIEVADMQLTIEIAGVEVTLCHFPPTGDHSYEDRYREWRPVTDGVVVHGHVHTSWKVRGKHINVGVDMWDFAPVSTGELAAILHA